MEEKDAWYILGNGLKLPDDEIEFFPYLKLKVIKEKPSIFDLAYLGSSGFKEWTMLEGFISNTSFEIVTIENDSILGYDTLNRAWLLNVLIILRKKLRINSISYSSFSWNNVAKIRNSNEKIRDLKIGLLDYHLKMLYLPNINEEEVNETDITWIKDNYEKVNLLANQNEKFKYSIEILNSWRFSTDVKSSIALIWSAIESIIGVSSEIVYRLSLNISSILEPRGESRIQKFREIKKLYGLRSKVVHGADLKEAEIILALEGSFLLLRDLIIYMIENDKTISETDFETAIFM